MRANTKQDIIYNMLYNNMNNRMPITTLHAFTNCMCIGAVCANLRKLGCVIENVEKRVKDEKGQTVVHSSYKMTKGLDA